MDSIINSKVESKNPDPEMDITQNSAPGPARPSSPGASFTNQTTSPQGSTSSPYVPISPMEAKHYYHGLYSRAVLVARSGTDPWIPPAGPEADFPRKYLRPVGNHPITEVWDKLLIPIDNILRSKGVECTSIDLPRIAVVGEPVAPVVVWIGVKPGSLSGEDGFAAVMECKQLLMTHQLLDVEVEIRESVRVLH
ncbi:unnamed protein product [Tuber aestivum]|uniref:Uncharacterized protein n=1 Tax=Tuber aestivum TaxID=59557 RepID=A0A292Q073_9PEZI|nr:unnamed protein product [Tuber aestivum]